MHIINIMADNITTYLAYPTKCTAFLQSCSVVEERSDRERHTEQHNAQVDEDEVEDEETVMIAGIPGLQDRDHRDDVCDHGCDHESDVHGRLDDPCDFFMWRTSRGAVGAVKKR